MYFFHVAAFEIYTQQPQLSRGWTPLLRAAGNGDVEVARLLLDAGANKAQGWMEPSLQKERAHGTSVDTRLGNT